jgi:hypothetical protein
MILRFISDNPKSPLKKRAPSKFYMLCELSFFIDVFVVRSQPIEGGANRD